MGLVSALNVRDEQATAKAYSRLGIHVHVRKVTNYEKERKKERKGTAIE